MAAVTRDPQQLIERGEDMRSRAAAMPTAEGKRTCLLIAEQYYALAEQAQRRLDVLERLENLR